jgi:hypothetical protein
MSIHYVIASYAGKKGSICRDRLLDVYPHPQEYLREHLRYLLKIKHSLTQITVMKAKTNFEIVWPNYYNINDLVSQFTCPIESIECPNFGLSYGQFFEAYQRDIRLGRKFDYYCFIEDDYVGAIDHFDTKLVDLYREKFRNTNGSATSGVGSATRWCRICYQWCRVLVFLGSKMPSC